MVTAVLQKWHSHCQHAKQFAHTKAAQFTEIPHSLFLFTKIATSPDTCYIFAPESLIFPASLSHIIHKFTAFFTASAEEVAFDYHENFINRTNIYFRLEHVRLIDHLITNKIILHGIELSVYVNHLV